MRLLFRFHICLCMLDYDVKCIYYCRSRSKISENDFFRKSQVSKSQPNDSELEGIRIGTDQEQCEGRNKMIAGTRLGYPPSLHLSIVRMAYHRHSRPQILERSGEIWFPICWGLAASFIFPRDTTDFPSTRVPQVLFTCSVDFLMWDLFSYLPFAIHTSWG